MILACPDYECIYVGDCPDGFPPETIEAARDSIFGRRRPVYMLHHIETTQHINCDISCPPRSCWGSVTVKVYPRPEGHEFASRGSLQSAIDLKPEAVGVARTKVL
jgi:hypothetical protein